MLSLNILPSSGFSTPKLSAPVQPLQLIEKTKTMSNEQIAQGLDALAAQRRSVGEDYSARSYETSAQIVRQHPGAISSGAQLLSYSGIGEKIASQIDLILQGGVAPEVQANEEMLASMDGFTSVYGIGEKTARQLWEKGYRSIDTVPDHELSHAQQLGKRFRHEFAERIPRDEVAEIEKHLQTWVSLVNNLYHQEGGLPLIELTVAGSYRRGQETCGDIDVLVTSRAQDPAIVREFVLQCPANYEDMMQSPPFKMAGVPLLVPYHLGQGEKKVLAVAKLPSPSLPTLPTFPASFSHDNNSIQINNKHRRIDFQFVTPAEYPFALLYFTGSGAHNKLMRGKALELGMTLNEYRLLNTSTGGTMSALTEKDIFDHLGMDYKESWERETAVDAVVVGVDEVETAGVGGEVVAVVVDEVEVAAGVVDEVEVAAVGVGGKVEEATGPSFGPLTNSTVYSNEEGAAISVMPFVATTENVDQFEPL